MTILSYVQDHPYQVAGGVFVVGALIVLALRSPTVEQAPAQVSYSGFEPGYNASVIGANAALASTGMAMQAHALQTQSALTAKLDENRSMLELGKAQFANTANRDNLEAGVAMAAITAASNSSILDKSTSITSLKMQNEQDFAMASMARDVALEVRRGDVSLGMRQFDSIDGKNAQDHHIAALGLTVADNINVRNVNLAGETLGIQSQVEHMRMSTYANVRNQELQNETAEMFYLDNMDARNNQTKRLAVESNERISVRAADQRAGNELEMARILTTGDIAKAEIYSDFNLQSTLAQVAGQTTANQLMADVAITQSDNELKAEKARMKALKQNAIMGGIFNFLKPPTAPSMGS